MTMKPHTHPSVGFSFYGYPTLSLSLSAKPVLLMFRSSTKEGISHE